MTTNGERGTAHPPRRSGITIAIGPRMEGWGSWEWLGADLARTLGERYTVRVFEGTQVPECDVVIVVKHALPVEVVEELARRCRVVYAPVDHYGAVADVDADHRMLRRCARIVVHSLRLERCLAPYAPIEYVDHHIRFASVEPVASRRDGELLWVGVRTNLAPLASWLRRHRLPAPLRILTNLEHPEADLRALGLEGLDAIVVEHWTPETHRRRLAESRAALDVKGLDFRSWHKPPAKALDFLASGLPLAMNADASAVSHVRERYGFEICPPTDGLRWFSDAYRAETRELGRRLHAELSLERIAGRWASIVDDLVRDRAVEPSVVARSSNDGARAAAPARCAGGVRVAVVSLLFEWPTRGGGNVHTYELVGALGRAGYDVRHVLVESSVWGTGGLERPLPYDHEVLRFTEGDWSPAELRRRLRAAMDALDPDAVILTDSWNAKPILAETLADYPTILRLQALECLCPLNNVRLLPGPVQCDGNQLADAGRCHRCLREHRDRSGRLHALERSFCGVGSEAYDDVLLRAFRSAAAVLVVNEETRRLVEPYANRVVVAPSGFDPARFPWPWPEEGRAGRGERRRTVLFAGHPDEPIKGYAVLREACRRLWTQRRDFEVVVTGRPLANAEPFERFVGWRSQGELPRTLRGADVCVVPSIAQEALGRVAVEAQAVGRPVLASRIGGLPTTIVEGTTGLLFEPGNPDDLALQLGRLLDDPEWCHRLGEAGRRRFESEFTWATIVDRCYQPLLVRRDRSTS